MTPFIHSTAGIPEKKGILSRSVAVVAPFSSLREEDGETLAVAEAYVLPPPPSQESERERARERKTRGRRGVNEGCTSFECTQPREMSFNAYAVDGSLSKRRLGCLSINCKAELCVQLDRGL